MQDLIVADLAKDKTWYNPHNSEIKHGTILTIQRQNMVQSS